MTTYSSFTFEKHIYLFISCELIFNNKVDLKINIIHIMILGNI